MSFEHSPLLFFGLSTTALSHFDLERDRAAWLNTITGIRCLFFMHNIRMPEFDDTDEKLLSNIDRYLMEFQEHCDKFTQHERNIIINLLPKINEE